VNDITEELIREAWGVLRPFIGLEMIRVFFEHGHWWLTGLDNDDDTHVFDVVDAVGPGAYAGLAFEGC